MFKWYFNLKTQWTPSEVPLYIKLIFCISGLVQLLFNSYGFLRMVLYSKFVFFFSILITPWFLAVFNMSSKRLGVPRTLSGVPQDQNCFHNNTKPLVAISPVSTLALIVQNERHWNSGHRSRQEARQRHHTPWKSLYPSPACAHSKKEKEQRNQTPVPRKQVLGEAVKIINFTKSQSLSAHLYNIPCDKQLFSGLPILRRRSCTSELWAELATFFLKRCSCLKE